MDGNITLLKYLNITWLDIKGIDTKFTNVANKKELMLCLQSTRYKTFRVKERINNSQNLDTVQQTNQGEESDNMWCRTATAHKRQVNTGHPFPHQLDI